MSNNYIKFSSSNHAVLHFLMDMAKKKGFTGSDYLIPAGTTAGIAIYQDYLDSPLIIGLFDNDSPIQTGKMRQGRSISEVSIDNFIQRIEEEISKPKNIEFPLNGEHTAILMVEGKVGIGNHYINDIKVGCQTFRAETIRRLWETISRINSQYKGGSVVEK